MSTLTLKGRWHGEEHQADRHFSGTIEDPGHTGLAYGDVVTVQYQHDQLHLHDSSTQTTGKYSLTGMPSDAFVLTSFVRKDGLSRPDRTHQEQDQLWGGEIYTRPPTPTP